MNNKPYFFKENYTQDFKNVLCNRYIIFLIDGGVKEILSAEILAKENPDYYFYNDSLKSIKVFSDYVSSLFPKSENFDDL